MSRPRGCDEGEAPLHYLVYIKRRLGTGRRGVDAEGKFAEETLERPAGHGFGQRWLYDLFERNRERGMVVWLFSVVRYGDWTLPPSLDAYIPVKRAFKRGDRVEPGYIPHLLEKYRYAFEAESEGAFYLPWNNAAGELRKIFKESGFDTIPAEVASAEGMERMEAFRSPRRLDREAVEALISFAAEVKERPQCFISYRRADAPLAAMQLAARLDHHGVAPWWDQWAMPRAVAEETTMLDENKLGGALYEAIEGSPLAVTLHTRHYATERSPWTREEERRIHERARKAEEGQGRPFQHIRIELKPSKYRKPACLKKIVDAELLLAGLKPVGGEGAAC